MQRNVCRNPNSAVAVVVVGLGCETASASRRSRTVLAFKTACGTDVAIEEGTHIALELVSDAHAANRRTASVADLTLGITVSDKATSTIEVVESLVGAFARTVLESVGYVLVVGLNPLVPHASVSAYLTADNDIANAIRTQCRRCFPMP